jgi:hypothetical protein
MWPLRLYHIFLHYLIDWETFGEKVFDIKHVDFLRLVSEIFLLLRGIQRDSFLNALYARLRVSSRYSYRILVETETSRQFSEKVSNIKFHENLPRWSRVLSRGRTERHGEANSRFPQHCERS